MWVYSLRFTSLTHSLLWVSMGPIVLNAGTWFLYLMKKIADVAVGTNTNNQYLEMSALIAFCAAINTELSLAVQCLKNIRKPSIMETVGILLGIIGATVMVVGVKRNNIHRLVMSSTSTSKINAYPSQASEVLIHPTIFGDAAAFSGAVAVCVYLIIGQKLLTFLPIWLYMFPVIGIAALTCLIFSFMDNYDPPTFYGFTST